MSLCVCACYLLLFKQRIEKKSKKHTHNGGDEKNNYFIIIYDNETTQNCHGWVCM